MYLAKFVNEWEYAQCIRDGYLFMRRLAWFKKTEEIGRTDELEATTHWLSADFDKDPDVVFAIAGTERRLYRAVSRAHHNPHLHHWFIYSMFAGYPRNFPPISDIDAFMEKIRRFPAHRFQEEFGPYTVLISNPREFVQRIKETCRLNDYTMKCGYVRYYESDQDSVGINEPDNSSAMFYKPQDYAYQQEYRIAIETGEYQTATLMLNIGDISDIAVIYETRSIFINTVLERDIPCINIKGHGPLTQPLQG